MTTRRGLRNSIAVGTVVLLALGVLQVDLQAAFLRWASTKVKTNSVSNCFNMANATLTKKAYTSVHKTASEVNGTKGGVYVAITCIGTTPSATAVVMVMSDNDASAIQARDEVIQTIKTYTQID
jgi:hypothetical protein